MKAMIFAAGLGTRLRPITNDRPKAMAEIRHTTLLEITIRRLIRFGFKDIIVNVHHFADLVTEFLASKKNFDINIQISDERDQLLDTGGGLKKAAWFFDDGEPFLVHNVDTITDVNLTDLYTFHKSKKALATLLVRHRPGSRFFLFDQEKRLCGWENVLTEEKVITVKTAVNPEQIAFSCLHIIDPAIFKFISETGSFSIIDVYLRLAKNHGIYGYIDDTSYWMDVGTPEKLKKAEAETDLNKLISGI
jgi:NDP-sugar pyrophosphorylase family protein